MNETGFSIDEICFIAVYKVESKGKAVTLARITAAFPYMDAEFQAVAESVYKKLANISESEFSSLSINYAVNNLLEDLETPFTEAGRG